jgi:pantetheine-phosphate adenylyltransferase
MPQLYHNIGLGGTFDRLHVGHHEFLQFAARLAEHVWVGVATSELTHHKTLAEVIESYEERERSVQEYLTSQNIAATVFPLTNPFGPTLQNPEVEAVAVTEMTVKGGEKINAERQNLGLSPLPVHICNLLKDETGQYISSTRIRAGKINRGGIVYGQAFQQDVELSESQRNFFHHKQGPVVQTPQFAPTMTYVVGDIVLETFLKEGWKFDVGMYDMKNNRNEYVSSLLSKIINPITFSNPAKTITTQMVSSLTKYIDQWVQRESGGHTFFKINGEEDLGAVALVLLAPLESVIYYGQHGEGMVEMKVTEELKHQFFQVLTEK